MRCAAPAARCAAPTSPASTSQRAWPTASRCAYPGAPQPLPIAGGAATSDAPPAVVHLNSASAEQLDALDGIGPALAQRIVDYREAHGGFGSIDQLDEVSGIGPVRLESLRARLAL